MVSGDSAEVVRATTGARSSRASASSDGSPSRAALVRRDVEAALDQVPIAGIEIEQSEADQRGHAERIARDRIAGEKARKSGRSGIGW